MMVVSPDTVVPFIVRSRARDELRTDRPNRPGRPGFLSTLLAVIRTNLHNIEFVSCLFGFLSIVALDTKGSASLTYLDLDKLAMDAIREHPDDRPQLHEVAFSLLKNMGADKVAHFQLDHCKEFVDSLLLDE